MHATFSISRLLAFVTLFFVLGGVSAAPIPLDEASTNEDAELAERGAMHNGGRGTYYYPGLGACGWYNGNKDMIVALSGQVFNKKSHCGKYISITARGKTHRAKISDMCPGCSANSLDMSPALFKVFAPESAGVINVAWHFS